MGELKYSGMGRIEHLFATKNWSVFKLQNESCWDRLNFKVKIRDLRFPKVHKFTKTLDRCEFSTVEMTEPGIYRHEALPRCDFETWKRRDFLSKKTKQKTNQRILPASFLFTNKHFCMISSLHFGRSSKFKFIYKYLQIVDTFRPTSGAGFNTSPWFKVWGSSAAETDDALGRFLKKKTEYFMKRTKRVSRLRVVSNKYFWKLLKKRSWVFWDFWGFVGAVVRVDIRNKTERSRGIVARWFLSPKRLKASDSPDYLSRVAQATVSRR